jgi:hypothetical protein
VAKKSPAKAPAKSAAKSSAKKPAAKVTKKAAAKKPAAKAKKASSGKNAGPMMVSSGRGATPAQLGGELVKLFNQGKADDWIQKVWSPKVRSIEGDGMTFVSPKKVLEKWAWWMARTEVLGCTAEGPYVGATGFAVKYAMHTKDKESGKEQRMTEVAVYTVQDGKIVQEEFMYGGM